MTSPDTNPYPGPLAGIRIADLTNVIMGPLGTRMLGDMGADVIRVEAPGGDIIRDYPPARNPKMSAMSINVNRNKRSMVLDLKSDEGRAAILDLVETCDVFVTNMRIAALERLGLGEEAIRERRPDIVFCVANGYGSNGPKADHAAYDDVIQAASGFASTFEWFGGPPQLVPSILADKVCGVHLAFAIASALHGRAVTGIGPTVEVPMAETMTAFNLVEHLGGQTFEPHHGDFSYGRIRTPNRRPRQTTDGWIVVLPYSSANWEAFWTFGGRPEFIGDPRFATAAQRVDHADELYGLLDEVVVQKSTADWLDFCIENSIPASEVADLAKMYDDEHLAAVGFFQEGEHPTEGPYRWVRDPIRFNGQNSPLRRPAPGLGENTAELLGELGWADDEIARMLAAAEQE